jgi:ornithine cyclodeaminase/alanine dehydrogenase-like protein (mu-crystallin family)
LGIEVRPVAAPQDAIADADIVALATNANEKVMESAWVEPGQHVSSVRFLELDLRAYEDSDRVVVNRAEPWIQNHSLGELCPQDIKDAKVPPSPPGAIEAREFFRQRIKRTEAREKTLFPNEASNYQLGGQFAAVAGFVLDRAREKGLGRELPADWFSQTLLP